LTERWQLPQIETLAGKQQKNDNFSTNENFLLRFCYLSAKVSCHFSVTAQIGTCRCSLRFDIRSYLVPTLHYDIPQTPTTLTSLFANDTGLDTHNADYGTAVENLQTAVNAVAKWARKWKISQL
jgi:hypothetical protein